MESIELVKSKEINYCLMSVLMSETIELYFVMDRLRLLRINYMFTIFYQFYSF